MKFTVLVVGKGKFPFVEKGVAHYLEQIRHFAEVEILELKDQSSNKEKEAQLFQSTLAKFPGRVQVLLLDERGKQYSSVSLAEQIRDWRDRGVQRLVLVVGGAYGFTEEMRSSYPLFSLSKLTFPHDLVRLILTEQLYRVLHILHGGKYHHEG